MLKSTNFEEINISRLEKYKSNQKLVIRIDRMGVFQLNHFVHIMEFFYFVTDFILNNKDKLIIVVKHEKITDTCYVTDFINKMYETIDNFVLYSSKRVPNTFHDNPKKLFGHDWEIEEHDYIIKQSEKDYIYKTGKYYSWFPNRKSNIMRDLFVNTTVDSSNIKIGLINRENNRKLMNVEEICDEVLKKFNLTIDVTYFEDKSFDYQIQFFRDHDIIISPHGAQLCSIPFLPDNGLLIECTHKYWHPYYYFSGLAFTCNKYHVMIGDDHHVFPERFSKGRGRPVHKSLNMSGNVSKIVSVISDYMNNNKKLDKHNCYLI